MLKAVPCWRFTARYSLRQWYGHVQLLPDHVLGQWFCAKRSDGKFLWEKRFSRPNTVVGVSDQVVIASETRSDGPWTLGFGCYGISLATGDLLWTSHANGLGGALLRGLDFLPLFTNDLRDVPLHVNNGECLCSSGRVLDTRNGRQLRRVPRRQARAESKKWPQTDAESLYRGKLNGEFRRIRFAEGWWLSHKQSSADTSPGFNLYMISNDDTVRWNFDLQTTGYQISHCNYFSYRYAWPHVYIVASEEPSLKPHPSKARHVVPNATLFHLLSLDLNTGRIVQDIRIADQKFRECRIEDVDATGILVSAEGRELWYYERDPVMVSDGSMVPRIVSQ